MREKERQDFRSLEQTDKLNLHRKSVDEIEDEIRQSYKELIKQEEIDRSVAAQSYVESSVEHTYRNQNEKISKYQESIMDTVRSSLNSVKEMPESNEETNYEAVEIKASFDYRPNELMDSNYHQL